MAISKLQNKIVYKTNGVNTSFPIVFDYRNDTDNLQVTLISSEDIKTILTIDTDYTVNNNIVILTEIPVTDQKIDIRYIPSYLQEHNILENRNLDVQSYTESLDLINLNLQAQNTRLQELVIEDVLGNLPDDAPEIGSIAFQNSDDVTINGGTITNIDVLEIASGGLNSSTASGARTNLGLGTIATQNSNSVTVTGGTVSGSTLTITTLTEDVTPVSSTDYIEIYDASTGLNKKVLLDDIPIPAFVLENDTSPSLGGDLDLNGFSIFGYSGAAVIQSDVSTDLTSVASNSTLVTSLATKTYTDTLLPSQIYYLYPPGPQTHNTTSYLVPNNLTNNASSSDPTTSNTWGGSSRVPFIIPIDGTITAFSGRCNSRLTAGATSTTVTLTIQKNGSNQSMTTNVSLGSIGTTTSFNVTTNPVSVTTGDLVAVLVSNTNSPDITIDTNFILEITS